MSLLEVNNLRTAYRSKGKVFYAVDDVSFEVGEHETVGLVGESGCGKSTLGKTIMRLVDPAAGEIKLKGQDIAKLPEPQLRPMRKSVQMVFQDPFASLNPRLSVWSMLETPLKVHGMADPAERKRVISEIAETIGFTPAALQRYPHEFSGGQRQRIGIARALILKPDLVVCDEPVSALDLSIQASPTLSRLEPNLSVITLPMFFGASRDDVRGILDGPLGAELWGMLATRGIEVPTGGHFEFAPNNTAYTVEPAGSYADLAGRTVATPPSPVVVAIMGAMGINGVATPRTEIVLQLTQGQIAGLGSVTDLTISGGRLWEAGIQYAFNDNAGWGVYIPLMSARAMANLTEAQRQIVNDAWGEVVGWARDAAAEELAGARAVNEEHGITYADPSDEVIAAMREQMVGVQDEIVASSGMNADYVGRVAAALHAM